MGYMEFLNYSVYDRDFFFSSQLYPHPFQYVLNVKAPDTLSLSTVSLTKQSPINALFCHQRWNTAD